MKKRGLKPKPVIKRFSDFFKKHRFARGIWHRECLREDRLFEEYYKQKLLDIDSDLTVNYRFTRILDSLKAEEDYKKLLDIAKEKETENKE